MGKFTIASTEYSTVDVSGKPARALKRQAFNRFTPGILGLGDISLRSEPIDSICAVFDLQGFTTFCNQVDPHLVVPEFMSEFLDWLFGQIRREMVERETPEALRLYAPLPFFAKFMGDGVLFLWDATRISDTAACNIVVSMYQICRAYGPKFLKSVRSKHVSPPSALRCGIARGRVCSVGTGEDYVGPCINIAARLQKLGGLPFAFSKRGFLVEKFLVQTGGWKEIVLRRVAIRGIGDDELVYVHGRDLRKLLPADRKLFRKP